MTAEPEGSSRPGASRSKITAASRHGRKVSVTRRGRPSAGRSGRRDQSARRPQGTVSDAGRGHHQVQGGRDRAGGRRPRRCGAVPAAGGDLDLDLDLSVPGLGGSPGGRGFRGRRGRSRRSTSPTTSSIFAGETMATRLSADRRRRPGRGGRLTGPRGRPSRMTSPSTRSSARLRRRSPASIRPAMAAAGSPAGRLGHPRDRPLGSRRAPWQGRCRGSHPGGSGAGARSPGPSTAACRWRGMRLEVSGVDLRQATPAGLPVPELTTPWTARWRRRLRTRRPSAGPTRRERVGRRSPRRRAATRAFSQTPLDDAASVSSTAPSGSADIRRRTMSRRTWLPAVAAVHASGRSWDWSAARCCCLSAGLVVFDVLATIRGPQGSPISSPLLNALAETFGW